MASNRKYKNGMWKDESKQQERESQSLFLRFQGLFKSEFMGMGVNLDQVTGECGYTYTFSNKEYFILLNRQGKVIQESLK